MSVGELVNLYRDGDLEIHPAFQRYFRWSSAQKTRFIESLLLGLPIPSIFVHQRMDGVWDVVDGVQRLSTILEFMGLLKDREGTLSEPTQLEATDYLPALKGLYWSEEQGTPSLEASLQRIIKRAPLDVKIISRESDENSKYDLFERLNTGGSALSDQELRNALLLMHNSEYSDFLERLSTDNNFIDTTLLTEKNLSESYDKELILRFLLLSSTSNDDLKRIGDLSDFLTKGALQQAKQTTSPDAFQKLSDSFTKTFSCISKATTGGAFRKWNVEKNRFQGGFTVSAYEAITLGVHSNLECWENKPPTELETHICKLWSEESFVAKSGGVRANTRIQNIVPFARKFFAQ